LLVYLINDTISFNAPYSGLKNPVNIGTSAKAVAIERIIPKIKNIILVTARALPSSKSAFLCGEAAEARERSGKEEQ